MKVNDRKQRHYSIERSVAIMTKITIFSGFLGAGKTTLIKKLINEGYKGEKLVLIENEFGDIGIDGGFLKDAGIEITEMNSGCICCSLVGDFGKALEKVLEEYHPDRILIEPSGVGKLSDVINAVQNINAHDVELDGFTTVVDAKKCKMYQKNFGEFFNNQITYASCIILSHTAGLTQEKINDVVARLKNFRTKKILLAPLLFNGGVHLAKDISDTWKNRLIALGYGVRVSADGLGAFEKFRRLYVEKLRGVIDFGRSQD